MNSSSSPTGTPLPLHLVTWILVLVDCLYHYAIRQQPWLHSIPLALGEGLLYSGILWITTRLDLARVSIIYLALPYIFFIPGWLNTPTALLLSVIFIYSLWRTLGNIHSVKEHHITLQQLAAFLAILLWVNLSGTGGYGYQTSDWSMHNARLHDLATLSWPIRYGENQNLVYYVGYFLPAAMIGKLTSVATGLWSLFPWTVLGVTLVIRWISVLSQWRFTVILVLVFALFGPLDIFNVLFFNIFSPLPLQADFATALRDTDFLDFRSWHPIGFFIGNYLSNTFQLYWSPQQVVVGWLGAGLLTYLYLNEKIYSLVFVYALLCLWAPFAMVALSPFIAFVIIRQLCVNWRSLVTFENAIGAGALAVIFVTFYLSGSTRNNLSFWIFEEMHMDLHYIVFVLFYLFAWGIYVLMITPALRRENKPTPYWFGCLVLALLALPLYVFGDYADLLCRGSAPLMFLLLAFLLKAIHGYWQRRSLIKIAVITCLLVAGSGSALLQNNVAIQKYGKTRPVRSIMDYGNAFPNLGPDNSPFERWFRKKLP